MWRVVFVIRALKLSNISFSLLNLTSYVTALYSTFYITDISYWAFVIKITEKKTITMPFLNISWRLHSRCRAHYFEIKREKNNVGKKLRMRSSKLMRRSDRADGFPRTDRACSSFWPSDGDKNAN